MTRLADISQHPQDVSLHETLYVSGGDLFSLGHYPGNPIYPGVLLLDHLLQLSVKLTSRTFGMAASAKAVDRIQFLAPVLPGDVVSLDASIKAMDAGSATVTATASVRGEIHARATITCGCTPPAAEPSPSLDLPDAAQALSHRDIARVLPHRYPFLLLDRIHTYKAGASIRASKVIHRDSPLLGRNAPANYPSGLAIESLGQAGIALCFLSRSDVSPTDILLGAISGVELLRPIPFDTVLTLEGRIERLLDNAMVLSGAVLVGQEPVIRVGNLVAMIDQRHEPQSNT